MSPPRCLPLRTVAATLVAATLAACQVAPTAPVTSLRPTPRAETGESAASAEIRAYFARVERDLAVRGLARVDGGGPDTPFNARQLADNFVRIALYDEYATIGGRLVARATPAPLRRWAEPVRIGIRFGASVPPDQKARDTASITAYAARLSRVSGHPIRVSEARPNFWVYVVSEDERPTLAAEWAGKFDGLAPQDLSVATELDRSTFCLVLAISESASPVYSGALAVIRSELPELMRQSCFHEEIAQGLGLANDHPAARPSIFNDDEEFALLTTHDEYLLRILYNPRLRPGMREAEARPMVEALARTLVGGDS